MHLDGGHRSDIALARSPHRSFAGTPPPVVPCRERDRADWERDFAAYVDGRGGALRGTAYLLCGDWHAAEDLTQTTLTKLYLAWRRIDRIGSLDAYARPVLLRALPGRAPPAVAAGAPGCGRSCRARDRSPLPSER